MTSDWAFVRLHRSTDYQAIVFIRDLNLGRMSVTNDAESVFKDCQVMYGPCRVVYEDSDGDLAEIVLEQDSIGSWMIFRPWHGLVWDALNK